MTKDRTIQLTSQLRWNDGVLEQAHQDIATKELLWEPVPTVDNDLKECECPPGSEQVCAAVKCPRRDKAETSAEFMERMTGKQRKGK